MKKSKVLNAESLLTLCTDVRKAVSLQSLILSAVLLVAGSVAYLLSVKLDDQSSALYMTMVTSSIVLLLLSVFRFIAHSTQVVYAPTGSAIQKDFCYFETDELKRIQAALNSADFTQLSKISRKQGGNIRLDYLLSRDGNFIALQLFQYIPYTYEPVTEVITFRNEDAKTLSTYLKRK